MHHDGIVVDDAVVPDVGVDLFLCENPVGVAHKILHEQGLFAGQRDFFPVFIQFHLIAYVAEDTGRELRVSAWGGQRDAPQARLHFGTEYHGAERLGDVIIGSNA